ncbi:MAG: neutral/alkaline non-lysosomal ceramidase N-terminal domain-containing protein, partial [Planctomycetaceae bacterium]|nr:neutral/alkaline non-lysosomal ceramidase N-terminal domain-containing protein [Planctomycetaceae bacterium]
MTRFIFVCLIACLLSATSVCGQENVVFKAGASCIDITPQKFPVIVNGGFFPQIVETVQDPLYARCLMLQNSNEQIVFIVVDSCLIPLPIAEEIKRLLHEKTGISTNRIMISATHCHSAPSLAQTLGSDPDNNYIAFLPGKIVEAVVVAQQNLVPAKIGWAVGNDPNNVYCRRFLMKKGTATTNPFSGKKNDRAQMNPGVNNPNKIARTGPVDTAVSVISVISKEDKPIALFANYSTHYAGVKAGVLSGDYFGVFAEQVKQKIAEKIGNDTVFNKMSDQFVGMMSNGTSGDANCIDFLNPNRKFDYQSVGRETAEAAMAVWSNIEYFDQVPLAMTEKRITLSNRLPTPEEIQAAKNHLATLPEGKLKT